MEQYFKNMINTGTVGLNPFTVEGTGMYLDTRPKFYKAIMRRLGVDLTHKMNYQEFAKMVKPSKQENVKRSFCQKLDESRYNSIM